MRERIDFLKKNTGFTLIELIVTIAVSAILLSVSVAGIVAWVHHSDFVRNENYAETIYYAAQAELTRYRGNGQLAELNMLVRNAGAGDADIMGKVPVNDITDDYRATLTGSGKLEEYNAKYNERLYYLKKNAGAVDENNPLGGLLSDYIYDSSIMEGSICVEFDPTDGTVYSVTYSDKNEKFTYGTVGENEEKVFSLRDRTRETRKKTRVGYFSTDLSDQAPNALGRTKIEKVQLINEEQLYLKWSMEKKFPDSATNQIYFNSLNYTIEVYEKGAGPDKLKYTFAVKGDLKGEESPLEEKIITCNVTEAESNTSSEYQFVAYRDDTGDLYDICLVLDAVDYGAPEMVGPIFSKDDLKNSTSILRLFSEPKDIYIKIQAYGKPYKQSKWERSNNSNTMFASMKKELLSGGNTYTIENARHLYNIRYWEALAPAGEKVTYEQKADISWPATDQKLYRSDAVSGIGTLKAYDKYPAGTSEMAGRPLFPAMPFLRSNSTLDGAGLIRNYALKDFVLYEKGNKSLGLIEENRGTVKDLTIENIYVEGKKDVGAVCGVNKAGGKLSGISVKGKVTGVENVGGIAGRDAVDETEGEKNYEQLTNYAEVSGSTAKIGGIVGSVGTGTKVKLCENYGAVKGTDQFAACIGGIAGYSEGTVTECISAPQDKPETKTVDGEKVLDEDHLAGVFVGGLVGYNHGGQITESGTKKASSGGEDAYIIGRRFVGGIVGYNDSLIAGSAELTASAGRTNQAQVIGMDYVGGVMGANALLDQEIQSYIEQDAISDFAGLSDALENCKVKEEYSSSLQAKNWINEGIIQAAGEYAGGIAGYNAGELVNCTTRINTSSSGGSSQTVLYGKSASYVGGVAGYNVGYIHNEAASGATVQVNSVVTGKNYIGGIVGYNGAAANADGLILSNSGKIENYALAGGDISGECFVGGYVGLNTTEHLFGTVLLSKPNKVTADYFAGGVIGALILAPEHNSNIDVNCATDNFFGEIAANEAFAGGYVAYTQRLKTGGDAKDQAKQLCDVVTGSGTLETKVETILTLTESHNANTDDTSDSAYINIIYSGDGGENRFASITAPVFAGGIVGCNSWKTRLWLQNIRNKVQVTATKSVPCSLISEEAGETFSFAGGITGLVTPYMVVDNCGNSNGGDVTAVGTFSGGIAEVNLGRVEYCTAGSASGKNNYGGIVGLNTNDGIITDCTLDGQISGVGYLGGMAARNESVIERCEVSYSGGSAVIGTGEYIGGIAAASRPKIKEVKPNGNPGYYTNKISNCKVNADIGTRNMGQYVGGLLGKYEGGTLTNSWMETGITVYGKNKVGGIIGQICADLSGEQDVENHADVEATIDAGGVGGELAAGSDIANCKNTGKITSQQGMAGGIVPVVSGNSGGEAGPSQVISCTNSGSVNALRKEAGGITADNYGTIKDCSITHLVDESGDVKAVEIEGINVVGGMAGENRGTIEHCSISGNVKVRNRDNGMSDMAVGGVAGRNNEGASITGITAESANGQTPYITVGGDRQYLGGVAGINLGTISGSNIKLNAALTGGQKGTIGGIAGANANQIVDTIFRGHVTGTDGAAYGTGGIAGRNEFQDSARTIRRTGTIKRCTLCTLESDGGAKVMVTSCTAPAFSQGWREKSQGVYLGGICGVNPEGGVIKDCTLKGSVTVKGRNGFVGGITGYNLGTLTGNETGIKKDKKDKVDETVFVEYSDGGSNTCVMGGVAGYNGEKGVVIDCSTGFECKVDSGKKGASADESHPTGGIIGCNQSIHDLKGLVNRASVTGYWITGGVIGLQQTAARSGFTIEECENYGDVEGESTTAGGIISDWRHQGGVIRKCINDGDVSVGSTGQTRSAGGIFGSGWWTTPISITVERCGNDGDIFSDQRAGGIAGSYNAVQLLNLEFTDCYNAGIIQNNNGQSAGIFGAHVSHGNINATFTRCVNYGRGSNTNNNFYGITAKDSNDNNLTMNKCLNVGYTNKDENALYKGDAKQGGGENYFFTYHWPGLGSVKNDGKGNLCVARYYRERPFGLVGPWVGGYFTAENDTEFDSANKRLYLDKNKKSKYIDFINVSASWDPEKVAGEAIPVDDLKAAFRTSDTNERYALLRYGDTSITTLNPPKSVKIVKVDDIYQINYEIDDTTGVYTTSYTLNIYAGDVKDSTEKSPIYTCTINDPTLSRWRIEGDEAEALKNAIAALPSGVTSITAGMRAHTTMGGFNPANSVEGFSDAFELKPQLPEPVVHFEYVSGKDNGVDGKWVLDNADAYKNLKAEWQVTITVRGGNQTTIDKSSNGEAVFSAGNLGRELIDVTATASLKSGNDYKPSDKFVASAHLFMGMETVRAERNSANDYGKFIGTKAGNLKYEFTLKQEQMSGNYNQYLNITYRADLIVKENGTEKVLGTGTVFLPNNQGENTCTIDLSNLTEAEIGNVIKHINTDDAADPKDPKVMVRFYPWEIDDIVKYYTVKDGVETSVVVPGGKDGGNFNGSFRDFGLTGLKGKYEMHPAPELEKLKSEVDADGVIKYTLSWDQKPTDNTAAYTYTVSGKTENDAENESGIILEQGSVSAGGTKEITLTEDNWKYQKLVWTVERTGGVSGGVTYIGASSQRSDNIPVRLDSVPKPDAKLPDKNKPAYEVSWDRSADADKAAGYRIVMRGKDVNGKDLGTEKIGITNANTTTAEIDLSEYPGFENVHTVEFSIITVSNDSSKYLDSAESPGVICEVPERLATPNVNGLELKLINDNGENNINGRVSMPAADFEKLWLKQTDNSADGTKDATYETEYFVTDAKRNPADFGEDWKPADGSAGWKEGSRPNQNADNGIYISREAVRMTGNLREASWQLSELNAEQAGRKIWYRSRAVSNDNISSPWTSWQNLELPKAELETVQLREEQTTDNSWPYTVDGTYSSELGMRQPKLVFTPVDFAAGYQISMKEADREEADPDVSSGDPVTGKTHVYRLEEVSDAAADDAPFTVKDDGGSGIIPGKSEKDGLTIYSYELYDMPHTFEIQNGSTTAVYEIKVKAKLCYSVKDGAVQEIWLELPEGQCLLDSGDPFGTEFMTMAAVDITVLKPEESDGPSRYVVNKLTRWERTKEGDTYKTEISTPDATNSFSARSAFFGNFMETMNADELGEDALGMLGIEIEEEEELIPEELEDKEKEEKTEETENKEKDQDVTGNNPDDKEKESGDTEKKPDDKEKKPDGTEEKPGDKEKEPDNTEKESGSTEKESGMTEKESGDTEKESGGSKQESGRKKEETEEKTDDAKSGVSGDDSGGEQA